MALPRPYYHDEKAGIVLYHADCRDALPEIEQGNALVTDPPYGIGWTRGTWNDSPDQYPDLIRWLVNESSRVIPLGWSFVFQAMLNIAHFHEWFPDGWRIFAACKNFAQIRPTGVWHSWDPVVFWHNGPNSGPNSGHVNRDYHVGNVAGTFRQRNAHPCPRPQDTMRHIICLAAPEKGAVVDPFAGSGTTLVAALETGRRAIGIEIEEKYCEIAAKRLEQGVLPFNEPTETSPIQPDLL
jgi:site-specific DNA-methyltransferase (adenine-specific)